MGGVRHGLGLSWDGLSMVCAGHVLGSAQAGLGIGRASHEPSWLWAGYWPGWHGSAWTWTVPDIGRASAEQCHGKGWAWHEHGLGIVWASTLLGMGCAGDGLDWACALLYLVWQGLVMDCDLHKLDCELAAQVQGLDISCAWHGFVWSWAGHVMG
jgi:hypothetical protein